jgi:hypothetical protein
LTLLSPTSTERTLPHFFHSLSSPETASNEKINLNAANWTQTTEIFVLGPPMNENRGHREETDGQRLTRQNKAEDPPIRGTIRHFVDPSSNNNNNKERNPLAS